MTPTTEEEDQWRHLSNQASALFFSSIQESNILPTLARQRSMVLRNVSLWSRTPPVRALFQPIWPSWAPSPRLSNGWRLVASSLPHKSTSLAMPDHHGPHPGSDRLLRHRAGRLWSYAAFGSRRPSRSLPFRPSLVGSRSSSFWTPRWLGPRTRAPRPWTASCRLARCRRPQPSSSSSGSKQAPIPTSARPFPSSSRRLRTTKHVTQM